MTSMSRPWRLIAFFSALVAAGCVALFLAQGAAATGDPLGVVHAPTKATSGSHTISVAGHGEFATAPDQATITLGVQTQTHDAQSALSNNSAKMNAVITAVEGQGVPQKNIQTSDLSIWYDSEHDQYVVSHQTTIRIDNVTKVGAVLDAAVAAGANNSWGVSFGLQDESAARSQALQSAVADARKRANAIASALGVTITGVSSAGEASYTVTPPVPIAAAPSASGATSTPVQPGQLTVTADVNVVYTFG